MIDNALDFEGLKYYDGKNKDYIQEQIDEVVDSLPSEIRKYAYTATAASTTNLDELTDEGIWYNYNKVCTGVPTEIEGKTILALIENKKLVNIIIQTLSISSNGLIVSWKRRWNGTTWGNWDKVASGTDLSKKVGIAAQYTTITPTNSISDILDIDTTDPYADKNQPKKVYQMTTDTTAIANMPPAYPKGTGFVGMRFVHYFSSTNILVELIAFPSGRRWYNNYVSNAWKGWTCEPTNANGDSISAVRNDLEDVGDTITANVVEVGGNDNITVYATLCLQKLSATKCNLFISYKITANTETDTTHYPFMSGSKIREALGVSSLVGNAVNSQVIFKPVFESSDGNLSILNADTSLGLMGYTGLMAKLTSAELQLGRFHTSTGSYGSWNLTKDIFKPNTYGQINFYGASYSI